MKNGKLCSYDNEITSLISEIERFSQSSTSDSDVAKQYVKQLSVWKQSDLYDSFREMIIKCVKIGISKDAIMQFINKALEIGLLDNERFANIKKSLQPYWIKGIRADKFSRKSRLKVSLNIIFSPTRYGYGENFCFIASSTQIFHNFDLSFGDAVGTLYLCNVIEGQK